MPFREEEKPDAAWTICNLEEVAWGNVEINSFHAIAHQT